ncbi:hypothetical protein MIND_01380300 [Mycena indigotica]|uniref:Uncharacterized protein n=1 Tax=Mycena indigotica TaxID=2126181 RepID=A0A8H6RYG8_9AGAR|nr:uncharacterized protein MIND_01380300 [Mycena indigotica]KAF7289192.1 hypothetical protein MIND_01380300 [Mycena indigotica]
MPTTHTPLTCTMLQLTLVFNFFVFSPFVLATHLLPRAQHTGIRMTNYYAGLGACGEWNNDQQYIVAISHLNYNNGQYCGKEISISYQGKTANAKIVDECMGCPEWGLDLSQSLFGHFVGGVQNDLNVGVINADWSFVDDNSDENQKSTAKASSIATHMTPKPSSKTSSKTSSKASSTFHSSSKAASSSHKALAIPTSSHPSASPAVATAEAEQQNLKDFNDVLVNLLSLVAQAGNAV